jgi:hypothetical protein
VPIPTRTKSTSGMPAATGSSAPTASPSTPAGSNGPTRPSSPRISSPNLGERTTTRTAPTTEVFPRSTQREPDRTSEPAKSGPPSSKPPRSVPPPLPAHALRPSDAPDAATSPPAKEKKEKKKARGVRAPMESVLDNEIDASLDKLELDGPTGTSLPSGIPQTGETHAAMPAEEAATGRTGRPEGLGFAGIEEATQNAIASPHTMRESVRSAQLLASATERPVRTTDPAASSDTFHPPPVTVPGEHPPTLDPDALQATGESGIPQELGSGELVDADDPTGAGTDMDRALESTHAGGAKTTEDEDIVIADDLAEDDESKPRLPAADDAEEHTDVGQTVPPYRTNS